MSVDVNALGIAQLSVGERLELIDILWNSLPEQVDPSDVPAWHLAELAKRRADLNANPGSGIAWREVLDRLETKS